LKGKGVKKMTQNVKDFLISSISSMRKELGIKEDLFRDDYKIENLKRIYAELTEQIDMFPQI
jgi:hypothetical protein